MSKADTPPDEPKAKRQRLPLHVYQAYNCQDIAAIQQSLETHGVAVLPGVLDAAELQGARDGLWSTIEHMVPSVDHKDTATWRNYYQLMPKHGMLQQHWGVGHAPFVWDIRQNPKVVNVFARLWKTAPMELLTSFDGFSFALPPEKTNRGWFRPDHYWLHVDQSFARPGLECYQGLVTLWDVDEGDATLCVKQGSHSQHTAFGRKLSLPDKSDWYKFTQAELKEYADCPLRCVKAKAGSLILWDSRTVHQGIEPQKGRLQTDRLRGAVYVCYTPRQRADPKHIKKKQEWFQNLRTCNHWPHKPKPFSKTPRSYGQKLPDVPPLPPPTLTQLGRALAGF